MLENAKKGSAIPIKNEHDVQNIKWKTQSGNLWSSTAYNQGRVTFKGSLKSNKYAIPSYCCQPSLFLWLLPWHFACAAEKVKRFLKVSVHCTVSTMKRISKMSTLPPWKNFSGRPCTPANFTPIQLGLIFWEYCVIGFFRRRRSAKTGTKSERGCGERVFFIFSKKCQNISTANSKIWIFLKNFKCKRAFFSHSLSSLLFSASRNVFTDSLAQSGQELCPTIESKAYIAAFAGLTANKKLLTEMSGPRNFLVRVQSWSDKTESDPVLIRKFFKFTSPIQSWSANVKSFIFLLPHQANEQLELFCH